MKCARCGKGIGVVRRGQPIADGYICYGCLDEMGYDNKEFKRSAKRWTLSYQDLKDGPAAYYEKSAKEFSDKYDAGEAAKFGIDLTHYKQLDSAQATENEIKIFAAICSVLADDGYDVDPLHIEPGTNGSLMIMLDDAVMMEYKSEPSVKWIRFPNESEEKIRIGGVGRINSLAPRISAAYEAVLV